MTSSIDLVITFRVDRDMIDATAENKSFTRTLNVTQFQ